MRSTMVLSVVLFLVSMALSFAALVRLIGQSATKRRTSIIWCIVIACAWSAWYASVIAQ